MDELGQGEACYLEIKHGFTYELGFHFGNDN